MTTSTKQIQPATPLPWKSAEYRVHGSFVIDTNTEEVGYTSEQNDAAYIVAACNVYPELVAALRGMYEDQMDYIKLNHLSGAENNHWMVIARALLARIGE